jgi:hypothetical protein
MEQQILLDCKPSRKWLNTLAFATLGFFRVFWLTIMLTIAFSFVFEGMLSVRLPKGTPLLIFITLALLITLNACKNGLRHVTITTEAVSWETFFRKASTVPKDEITHIAWKSGQTILNRRLKINTASLPKKQRVLFNAALLNWAPQSALETGLLQFRQFEDGRLPETDNGNLPISINTGNRIRLLMRGLGIAALAAAVITLTLTWENLSLDREGIFTLSFLGGMLLITFWGIWTATSYRAIRVDDEGILYQSGRTSRLYRWREIEAIGVEARMRRFLIWERAKAKENALPYSRMKTKDVAETANTISQQALLKKIPLSMV